MKHKIYVLLALFLIIFSFSKAQNNKTKIFKNKHLKVEYPKTWFKFGAIGYVYFIPKTIRKNTFENEVEHVSINKNIIPINNGENVENVLKNYSSVLMRNEIKKTFEIVKLESYSKFIYKITSSVIYNSIDEIYKRVEYFFINKDEALENYRYQMREGLFDKYYDDAMLIINSIEKR
ncbi:MAG: hypothetical protein HKP48_08010 [Winogradskyella sp.]|uniref:hypothetical protein n=1 Tax=Winogradskyella sp. TaxID=1883156 RepID=UPI0017D17C4D|nr:hypothetical protein [Winogradskyella sp.]MBT8245790.1 hypothetical protein [Winogradskyella sp.]NNK23225.1 hypothetical protein [Winogradskyella sp.]